MRIENSSVQSRRSFQNTKTQKLIHRIISLASEPGDSVLDSFAVQEPQVRYAHKMEIVLDHDRTWRTLSHAYHSPTEIK